MIYSKKCKIIEYFCKIIYMSIIIFNFDNP